MVRLRDVARAVTLLCTGGASLFVGAQQQTSPPPSQLERVEVTGSRIKRIDTETPAPVQVITRQDIERSGAQSVTEVLKKLPSNNTGTFNENAVASFTPGAGSASLRGLGAQATLILINGRRVAPFGFASGGQTTFVDINQIPIDVVERIEVLLDGASAIYGSDAIGGVINVILRKDYNGLQLGGSYGVSTHGDADEKRGSITWGRGSMASDGYNFFVNYQHIDQKPVLASQREYTASSDFRRFGLTDLRSSYAFPGNLYTVGGAFIQPLAPCVPLNDPTAPALAGRCVYNQTSHQTIIADTQRDAVTVAGTFNLGRGFELFGDAIVGRTKAATESVSYNSATYNSTGTLPDTFIRLPVGHPQNPTGNEIGLRYRFADVPFTISEVSDTQRAVLGVRNGNIAGWDVESGILYSHSRTKVATTGLINDEVLLNEVLDANAKALPSFTFGNPSANDPALMSRLYPTLHDLGTTTTTSFDLRGSRDIFKLPAGQVGLAVGVEVRHEKYSSIPDPITASGVLSVLGASSAEGGRTIQAGYAELSIPVFKNFEASLAGRYDHYSDFGSTTNPKVGFKWKVLPQLALRGTYATGFRAPALTETTQSPSRGFFTLRDPVTCPVPDPANPNCEVSVEAISGANPALQPEKAKSLTAGIIFEPLDNLSLAFDAFRIKRRNEIASIDPDYLLAHEADFPGYVTRNPDGTIDHLNLIYTNLGSTKIWGFDIEGKGSMNVAAVGKLGMNVAYEWLPHYWVANVKDAPELDYAGTYLQPKSRVRVGFSLDRGPWAANLTFNYTGKYLRAFTPSDLSCPYDENGTNTPALCSVKSWLTTDLFIGYKGFKNLELGLTITNLDNVQAPFDERMETRYTAFRSDFHSGLGRFFMVSAKYTFW
jgi:iron complex outermembrane receptor protein